MSVTRAAALLAGNRLRGQGADLRSRSGRLRALTGICRRAVRALREPPPRPGEASVDSGALVAWLVGVLLCLGAVLLAGIGAAVVGAWAP